jgi:hypothetical protein
MHWPGARAQVAPPLPHFMPPFSPRFTPHHLANLMTRDHPTPPQHHPQARVRSVTDSKNLFIGQYNKFFEEYWLSPIL